MDPTGPAVGSATTCGPFARPPYWGSDLAIGGLVEPPPRPKREAARETCSLGGWRGGAEMRLVTRIAAAISSVVALVLAGGAGWKL